MIIQRAIRGTAALLLVGAVATGAGMGMRARSAPPKPERRSVVAADENRYRASFKDGATVEVVAVSTVPTGPHTWWKPDGTPLAEAPADTIESKFSAGDRGKARVVLVRSSGVREDDMFRWHPTRTERYWGGQPTKDGQSARELGYYEATFEPGAADCGVQVRVAGGAWTTETSHAGGGGFGNFVNGHKFCFGRARAYQAYGRTMTAMAVAHNFLGKDRRLVAVDRDGKVHAAAVNAMGSDGDPRWVLDLIDAEFDLTLDRIKEFQVQFRPYEEAEIKGIALKPRPDGK